jgi:hypothetical protein
MLMFTDAKDIGGGTVPDTYNNTMKDQYSLIILDVLLDDDLSHECDG